MWTVNRFELLAHWVVIYISSDHAPVNIHILDGAEIVNVEDSL